MALLAAIRPVALPSGKAVCLTTWLKSENPRCVCVMSEMLRVKFGPLLSPYAAPYGPTPLALSKHLFPFPGKRVRAGPKRQPRELDTARPRTFFGQRKKSRWDKVL